jgi:hypothetical protein
MKKTTKNTGIKVNAGVKAGGLPTGWNGSNHNRNALKVKAGVRAGAVIQLANHNTRLLPVA